MQTDPGERRNLLLLTIDAWRADSVDEYAGIPLTPTLHALRERTLRFSHAYATAPWTSPAIVSILTGQSALEHGVHYEWDAPRPGGPALPALLGTLELKGLLDPVNAMLSRMLGFLPNVVGAAVVRFRVACSAR